MTINIKSLNNKYLMLLFVVLLTACSHNESDGHKHGTTQEAKEEKTTGEVEEESTEATIASLTDEQIKTVGIQFGSIEQLHLKLTVHCVCQITTKQMQHLCTVVLLKQLMFKSEAM